MMFKHILGIASLLSITIAIDHFHRPSAYLFIGIAGGIYALLLSESEKK